MFTVRIIQSPHKYKIKSLLTVEAGGTYSYHLALMKNVSTANVIQGR
jgi:hypothetical protein